MKTKQSLSLLLLGLFICAQLPAQISYQEGFPIIFSSSKASNPLVTEDINPNYDGKEIISLIGGHTQTYKLVCYSSAGELIFENDLHQGYSFPLGFKPIIADVDNNGQKEIILSYKNWESVHTVNIWNYDGSSYNNGWPLEFACVNNISTADIDNDGDLEIAFVSCDYINTQLSVYHHDATLVNGWPKDIPLMFYTNGWSAPIIADLNCDNEKEVIFFVTHHPPEQFSKMYVLDNQGNILPGWPHEFDHIIAWKTPVVANLDPTTDSSEIVMVDEYADCTVYAFNYNGSYAAGWPVTIPSSSDTGGSNFENTLVYEDSLGNQIYTDESFRGNGSSLLTVADLQQNGSLQVIVVGFKEMHILNSDGSVYQPFPELIFPDKLIYSPSVADIDNDDNLDLILLRSMT